MAFFMLTLKYLLKLSVILSDGYLHVLILIQEIEIWENIYCV